MGSFCVQFFGDRPPLPQQLPRFPASPPPSHEGSSFSTVSPTPAVSICLTGVSRVHPHLLLHLVVSCFALSCVCSEVAETPQVWVQVLPSMLTSHTTLVCQDEVTEALRRSPLQPWEIRGRKDSVSEGAGHAEIAHTVIEDPGGPTACCLRGQHVGPLWDLWGTPGGSPESACQRSCTGGRQWPLPGSAAVPSPCHPPHPRLPSLAAMT